MPCRVDEPGEYGIQLENNRLTRILCYITDRLDRREVDELCRHNREYKAWVEQHRREDEARKRREQEQAERDQARQKALQKLHPAEMRLLGLM